MGDKSEQTPSGGAPVPVASRPAHDARRAVLAVAAWAAAFAVINLAVYWRHWVGQASFTNDFPAGYYASTAYWIAAVGSGEWPQWMPYESMGYPAAMNVHSGT